MGILGVLSLGMIGSKGGGDSAKANFKSWSSTDVVSLSTVSQLTLSLSKACLMSPMMEMTPHGPNISRTK
jgi:hypothetical protein